MHSIRGFALRVTSVAYIAKSDERPREQGQLVCWIPEHVQGQGM
jgi:hypothetical protein